MSDTLSRRVEHHLARLYPERDHEERATLARRAIEAFGGVEADARRATSVTTEFRDDEVMLITYADTFRASGQSPLQALATFRRRHLSDVFSSVHVLPFFPSSSDGGFAVVDYRSVAEQHGDWNDLARVIDADRDVDEPPPELMVDLVCNHGSAQSTWFENFVADVDPGREFFVTVDPDDDLGMVVRPRTHPLLRETETAAGTKHVWATFSHDQVDFDFANPEVLIEFCSILGHYVDQGATRVRLDAIAYLWKRVGTSCVHLPETHEVVKLMRSLLAARDPKLLLVSETNVPHRQNISYFGGGAADEAQVVYNFTLAPLIIWSAIAERGDVLTNWLGKLDPPGEGRAFLNFLASHDGIGLRPVEDLVPAAELAPLVDAATASGGSFSEYSAPGGPRPYELNVSLADLLAGVDGEYRDRYVLAHALMLAVQGIPAIYVHSMLATAGDVDAVARTKHKRDINRPHLSIEEAEIAISTGWRGDVFGRLTHLITTRRSRTQFGPTSPQVVHVMHRDVVAVERGSGDQKLLALHNVSGRPCELEVPEGFGRTDLISGTTVEPALTLKPWQAVWLV